LDAQVAKDQQLKSYNRRETVQSNAKKLKKPTITVRELRLVETTTGFEELHELQPRKRDSTLKRKKGKKGDSMEIPEIEQMETAASATTAVHRYKAVDLAYEVKQGRSLKQPRITLTNLKDYSKAVTPGGYNEADADVFAAFKAEFKYKEITL
jgi:hypothetical protein